eukprot:COSAG01_NODE_4751_length_4767_cov_3.800985_3_plen_223_part_00
MTDCACSLLRPRHVGPQHSSYVASYASLLCATTALSACTTTAICWSTAPAQAVSLSPLRTEPAAAPLSGAPPHPPTAGTTPNRTPRGSGRSTSTRTTGWWPGPSAAAGSRPRAAVAARRASVQGVALAVAATVSKTAALFNKRLTNTLRSTDKHALLRPFWTGCSWRPVALKKAVNYSCVQGHVAAAVMAHGHACFATCTDGDQSDPSSPSVCAHGAMQGSR